MTKKLNDWLRQPPAKRQRVILFKVRPGHIMYLAHERPGMPGKREPIGSTPRVSFNYADVYRRAADGIGMERIGIDKARITAHAPGIGHTFDNLAHPPDNYSPDLHKYMRRIRPEDAAELAEIEEKIRKLQEQYRVAMEAAFDRAEPISMQRIIEDCEEQEEVSRKWREQVAKEQAATKRAGRQQ